MNIHTTAGLDAFVDHLESGAAIISADMGAGSGQVASDWFDAMYEDVVPVEWLKSEWRKRGLLKRVQLTISGCVGPCDVPNVVVITSSSGTEWLGNIVKFDQYRTLIEWAVSCRNAGEMLALPREFHGCKISPFCS